MTTRVDFDSPAVSNYLGMLQGIINRMAANSSGCKTWCIALVSAVIVIIADKSNPDFVWISVFPVILFLFLDAYYLDLERRFRNIYNGFIKKLHAGEAELEDVFIVEPETDRRTAVRGVFSAVASTSIWPFYGLLALMLVVVRAWIL